MLKNDLPEIFQTIYRSIGKKTMKKLLISLLILSSWQVLSQERGDNPLKSDISFSGGVALAENSFGRFGLMYRKSINKSLKLKISGYYSKFYSFNSVNNYTLQIPS